MGVTNSGVSVCLCHGMGDKGEDFSLGEYELQVEFEVP